MTYAFDRLVQRERISAEKKGKEEGEYMSVQSRLLVKCSNPANTLRKSWSLRTCPMRKLKNYNNVYVNMFRRRF